MLCCCRVECCCRILYFVRIIRIHLSRFSGLQGEEVEFEKVEAWEVAEMRFQSVE